MPIQRKELPDVGELVVATVKEVYDYGAYLTLDEYGGLEAYLPWSEVASRWVRSIHDVVKPGQKIVVKVIRVNKRKKQVDVSLKRVTDSERRRKMMEWKRAQKAERILELVAQKLGKSLEEAYEAVGKKLEDYYGELMAAFEEVVIRGEQALREAGVPEEWVQPLLEEIKRHVEVKRVKIAGVLTVRSLAGDGIERVKKVLLTVKDAIENSSPDIKVKLYTVGAPRYRLELEAYDYKTLEKALAKALEEGEETAKSLGVEFSFTREKQ
ncbi:translation initiation factor IF-2 subunit alpha [Hyperthermus butylicus]|uniref:Translation initiation factor 2 subunit alpha n=1 Tax=Hyperthermus butylicus (strain DSM 5456 / JCM 9403 / PLM1-5) TaxID=415426 RepID=IF2A_HYPBU|nr:translation initiation factor IF-2 subunit alpha [Hyperthermus butylicus]A2BN93.1 RecName: Full=Translation initiation factor 2 subunit alpha; AltName: Full=aIF2-alpha; AltName: Full=eIF-2-alpha [Hyperthermus butylicus DSM 5456]ABM81454.1 translation initiation factor 2 alpha [Hyperthermus butylicus DSM 5456]